MKRTELKRKAPLKAKAQLRAKVQLKARAPMKVKRKPAKSAAIKRHLSRVAAMPCIISGKPGPSTLHHVRHKITRSGTFARDDRRVVPLAPEFHLIQHGPRESVEAIHEAGIFEKFGINLWAEAERLWEESCNVYA